MRWTTVACPVRLRSHERNGLLLSSLRPEAAEGTTPTPTAFLAIQRPVAGQQRVAPQSIGVDARRGRFSVTDGAQNRNRVHRDHDDERPLCYDPKGSGCERTSRPVDLGLLRCVLPGARHLPAPSSYQLRRRSLGCRKQPEDRSSHRCLFQLLSAAARQRDPVRVSRGSRTKDLLVSTRLPVVWVVLALAALGPCAAVLLLAPHTAPLCPRKRSGGLPRLPTPPPLPPRAPSLQQARRTRCIAPSSPQSSKAA